MTIAQIAILAALAVLIGQLRRGREFALLAVSALAVFWLQPEQPFAILRYWLPVSTLVIVVLCWALTSSPEVRGLRQNAGAIALLVAIAVLAGLNRYAGLASLSTVHTPALPTVIAVVLGAAIIALAMLQWQQARRYLLAAAFAGIMLIFVFLKTPALIDGTISYLLKVRGADLGERITALTWLGYSYLAFRLLHTIRDRQSGRMPAVTLSEYVNYAVFFPAFTAGPIDRVERFVKDLCAPQRLTNEDWMEAGRRLFFGSFKKFVVADLLAVISISDGLVPHVRSAGWMWVFLYAYALRIYFDFSGYTDIAIGLARLMGIRLPENFASPYLKPNLTQFWNSWHMTLTQWFRAYFFNPLTRWMRSKEKPVPAWLAILTAQLGTMLLIGLWHGVSVTFVLWGLWHGIGLFVHNRWGDFVRSHGPAWLTRPGTAALANAAGIFLTFNYVALGWVFFSLSTPAMAWLALGKLLGAA